MDLSSTAAELYGLPPGEFIAARTAAEKQARTAGDRELAGRIHALAKPTAAAWIANQLARRHPAEIGGLRELGAGLREATAGLEGEQLRQLSQQQNRVIAALVAQARGLAKDTGQPMSDATERGLEATLRAALADEDLADQLASGQLTVALEHIGFSGFGGTVQGTPKPAVKSAGPPRDELKERRQRAERDRAQAAVREARTAQRHAAGALDAAEAGLSRADAAVAEASAAAQRAESEHEHAKQARDQAKKAAMQATGQLEKAQTDLAKLEQLAE